ncbi:polysaccharide biosynthesis tyrosine autokinase [Ruficoccus amylovorans]|uniref:non-specific protein-tyrosine kinase n=1 Tax=Ruficoccus amylovorans TaxID=1804625 RepID=A0A842HCC8_9BACT|nr:polysaccharide biosynthesis tyrosine autokinase [Ruficoccus amylovorans]MBC2594072.1 polysaccharide biosynthesis tyrosine autokinase [Ruficoccus amylovorans]
MAEFGTQQSEGDFDWSEMLHSWFFKGRIAFQRMWWVFLLTVGLGVSFQAYKGWQQKPVYQSRAKMIVDGQIVLTDKSAAQYSEVYANFYGTQVQLMTSSLVRQKAADRVRALHPEYLPCQVTLNVTQSKDANIFNLSAWGAEQNYTQAYLDAVMEEYLNFKRDRRESKAKDTVYSLQENLLEYQRQIEELEQQKLDFQKKNNIIFVQEQGNTAGAQLASLKDQQAQLKTQLRLLEEIDLDRFVDQGLPPGDEQALVESVLTETDTEYGQARRNLERLRAEMDEFSIYMKPKHPKIIDLKREIERQENLLKIIRRQTLNQVVNKKKILAGELANLNVVIQESEQKALKYSTLNAEFDRIKSRLASYSARHDSYLKMMESLHQSENIHQEPVTILEPATTPTTIPVNMFKQVTSGGLVGLALGVGILFAFAMTDNRLTSVEDVTQRFHAPVLGIIPLQKQRQGEVTLLQPNDDRLMFAESCRNIRSSLLFMDRQGPRPQTILVTSSIPAEGKSTLSSNLAITLAFASSKTLIIDADLRRGKAHRAFGLNANVGLSELLNDTELKPEDVIQQTSYEGLDLIATGEYPERPGELLMSTRFDQIMDELKKRYDYIILDCPPVLATDDTPSLATKADAVLFIIRSTYTRTRQIKSAVDTLELRGTKIRGFVLNFVDNREPNHYYYKYYDYYSYRSYAPKAGNHEKDKKGHPKHAEKIPSGEEHKTPVSGKKETVVAELVDKSAPANPEQKPDDNTDTDKTDKTV